MDLKSKLPAVEAAASQRWAAPEDWEQFRPLIKQLYIDEDRTLKDVMNIMARNHRHRGTVKMYKGRITKWGLDKNHKERDMRAILRKQSQRDAIGKQSIFRVRGQGIRMEDVDLYFKRKGISDPAEDGGDAPTPSALSCQTPSPPHSPMPSSMEENSQSDEAYDDQLLTQDKCQLDSIYFIGSHAPLAPNEEIGLTLYERRRPFPSIPEPYASKIPHSLVPPQSLVIPERLFFNVKNYFRGSFEGGKFSKNSTGILINAKVQLGEQRLNLFINLWSSAVTLLSTKSFMEGRRLLSKASELVMDIIREEHPKSLEGFLDMFLYLGRMFPEVGMIFGKYIAEIAGTILPVGDLWREILIMLKLFNPQDLPLIANKAWTCTNDALEETLGRFNYYHINSYLRYLGRLPSSVEKERILRNLVEEGRMKLPAVDLRTFRFTLAIALVENRKIDEAMAILNIELGHLQARQASGILHLIQVLELLGLCEIALGNTLESMKRFLEALKICRSARGEADSLTLRILSQLQYVFRQLGHESEADAIKGEIEEILGPDDAEEVPGYLMMEES